MAGRKRALIFVACTALVLALPFADAAGAKTKDGCKALSTEDVNTAFSGIAGGEAPDGAPTKYKGYTSCTWTFPGGVTVFIGLNKVNKANKADFKKRSKADDAEKVSGVKKSFIAPVETGGGGTVTFIDGTTFVNLQYFTTDEGVALDSVKDGLISLAKKAAKKL